MIKPAGFGLFMSVILMAALPALAQDDPVAPPEGLSTGEPVEPTEPAIGETYVREIIQDWQVRCVKTETGVEPCQMYQLLEDAAGTPTSEIVLFKVENSQIAAGATIVTPLETLLTRALTITIPDLEPKRYPFNFCNSVGCIAQIGLSAEEVDAMKRGVTANMLIVPRVAPNTEVNLTLSLAGFTAAFDRLQARTIQ